MDITLSKEFRRLKGDVQYAGFFFFLMLGVCMMILMRKKKITPLQNYYLCNLVGQYISNMPDIRDRAHHMTNIMAELQEKSSFMGFLHVAAQGEKYPKAAKKEMIVNVMIMVMLDNQDEEDYCEPLSYVGYIMEDMGLGSKLTYHLLVNRAFKHSEHIRNAGALDTYDCALEIMRDALLRSNIKMS